MYLMSVVVAVVSDVVVVCVSQRHCTTHGQLCRGTAPASFLSSLYMSTGDVAGDSV